MKLIPILSVIVILFAIFGIAAYMSAFFFESDIARLIFTGFLVILALVVFDIAGKIIKEESKNGKNVPSDR